MLGSGQTVLETFISEAGSFVFPAADRLESWNSPKTLALLKSDMHADSEVSNCSLCSSSRITLKLKLP